MARVVIYAVEREEWLNDENPREIIEARQHGDVLAALQYVESFVQERGAFAAGFISYEAAPAFDATLRVRQPDASFPLLWFALLERPKSFRLPSTVSSNLPLTWQPNVSRQEYRAAIERIKQYIGAGDTYQVNYSFRLRTPFEGEPFSLFCRLVAAQPSRYAAFIETDAFAICSASPELFFSLNEKTIIARPMKGTMPRGLTCEDDNRNAEHLRISEKDRAENVMIVDMMRNDLGRIAEIGSVSVPSLFDIERYPTVWQMTSSVKAETDASIADIMRAVFPCASVTGAPKARTMEIIAELESAPRKIYTGAIGFIAPNRHAQFTVAIRTVLVDRRKQEAEYGVGGGVVWGSTVESEYEECLTKARILTDERPDFELFETILFAQQEGFALLEEHLERLKVSADYFQRRYDEALALRMIRQLQHDLQRCAYDCRVRMVLHADGSPTFAIRPVESVSEAPVRVKLAAKPIDSKNLFLYHKTTYRNMYDEALASVSDCDDVILWNEREEITESTVANIVLEMNGTLYTPPVSCGLLPGTFRGLLLKEGTITERVLKREDVKNATQLFLINSVRKWRKAVLV